MESERDSRPGLAPEVSSVQGLCQPCLSVLRRVAPSPFWLAADKAAFQKALLTLVSMPAR
jgi:hypothetical protein